MMTDPIADMLTRIRNAALVKKTEVRLPYSKLKRAIAEILVREGYLQGVDEAKDGAHQLVVKLKYTGNMSVIQSLKRVSSPGHRRYVKKDEVEGVLNGFGIGILSTPQGILTDVEARAAGVGGELLCEVY